MNYLSTGAGFCPSTVWEIWNMAKVQVAHWYDATSIRFIRFLKKRKYWDWSTAWKTLVKSMRHLKKVEGSSKSSFFECTVWNQLKVHNIPLGGANATRLQPHISKTKGKKMKIMYLSPKRGSFINRAVWLLHSERLGPRVDDKLN